MATRRPLTPTLTTPYPRGADAELEAGLEAAALLILHGTPTERRDATRYDPLLMGLVYFPHHLLLADPDEAGSGLDDGDLAGKVVTLADWHLDLCAYALTTWTVPAGVREHRDLFAAPRDSGKSTWLYLILPVWAGAHRWSTFTAAFADTALQAEEHLGTLRNELEGNPLLATDYPDLCTPKYRRSGRTVSDRVDALHQASGWRIVARGIDRGNLGLKKGADRPDLLLLDDLEPEEARYSETLARKRRRTFLESILPMNVRARVVYTGTVVMFGSIVHQALRHSRGELTDDELADASWVDAERFTVHHVLPIAGDNTGARRSYWPARFPLAELEAMEGTRSYRKNYLNLPLPGEGDWWTEELYRYDTLPGYGASILYIDPHVKKNPTSKGKGWTGLAVVSRSPAGEDPAVWVRYTTRVRVIGKRLRNRVEAVIADHPDIRRVIVETNQGGDYLLEALEDIGPPVSGYTEVLSKEVRCERVLDLYERAPSRVIHVGPQPMLEAEQTGYPEANTRDVLDAVNGAVLYLTKRRRRRGTASSTSYL